MWPENYMKTEKTKGQWDMTWTNNKLIICDFV